MKPLTPADVLDILQYEKIRDKFRAEIIELKKDRRVSVGNRVAVTFENRETMRFQIMEMMRAERMVDDEKIIQEVETYNTLLPGDNELSATLFIEITDEANIRTDLHGLVGVDEHVFFDLGKGRKVRGVFEEGRSTEDKLSAVQYVKFPFGDGDKAAFKDKANEIALVVDHPKYKERTVLPDGTRASLASDWAHNMRS